MCVNEISRQPAHKENKLPRCPVFIIPFRRDGMFVGHKESLEETDKIFDKQHGRAALAGIGGVGYLFL